MKYVIYSSVGEGSRRGDDKWHKNLGFLERKRKAPTDFQFSLSQGQLAPQANPMEAPAKGISQARLGEHSVHCLWVAWVTSGFTQSLTAHRPVT